MKRNEIPITKKKELSMYFLECQPIIKTPPEIIIVITSIIA